LSSPFESVVHILEHVGQATLIVPIGVFGWCELQHRRDPLLYGWLP